MKPNFSKRIFCFMFLNAIGIFLVSCDSSKTSNKTENTPKSTEIEDARFNPEKFVDHDKAIALWLLKQDSAITILSQDNKGMVRIEAYHKYLAHLRNNPRDRDNLIHQKSAIDEFISSYSGDDKNEILQRWLEDQEEAKDSLKSFLNSIGANTDVRKIKNSEDKSEYEQLILIQEFYMDRIDEYRNEWREWARSRDSEK